MTPGLIASVCAGTPKSERDRIEDRPDAHGDAGLAPTEGPRT
ncbi:hypothetical protein AB0J81_26305 [Streptomyces bobili]